MGRAHRQPSFRVRVAGVLPALLVLAALPAGASAATTQDLWTPVAGTPAPTHRGHARAIRPDRFRAYRLDRAGMRSALAGAPTDLALPAPRGGFQHFTVRPVTVLAPGLARRHPDIVTLAGYRAGDRSTTVRVDLGPLGFHASVRGTAGSWYVDPYYRRDQSTYAAYFGRDLTGNPHGLFVEREVPQRAERGFAAAALPPAVNLRTYRLALLSDPNYAAYFSDPGDSRPTIDAKVAAAKTTLIQRVDQVYEEELAVRLVLIAQTDQLDLATDAEMTGADGPCGHRACFTVDDPSTPADPADGSAAFCSGLTLEDNQDALGQVVGASSYDIGHIALGVDGGGVADLGVVGGRFKGMGCTGLADPIGDFYAIDYVAHEMGHQFGGNHPFNGTQHNCGPGNREPSTSVEPGSGSSIMAYAGICRQDNLQPHSDPYFSQRSFEEMTNYISGAEPAVNEVQNVSLTGFGGSDSFRLTYNGQQSSQITRGVNYTRAGIAAALHSIPDLAATPVSVDRYGHTGEVDNDPAVDPGDEGFQVTFGGGADFLPLSVTSPSGITASQVGETEHGGAAANGGAESASVNTRPVVTVPGQRSIPARTPFSLTGSAIDPDGDPVTYMWEQNDIGGTDGTALADNLKVDGPLFRQFGTAALVSDADSLLSPSPGENAVTADPTRVFPDMAQILAGTTNAATGTCPPAPPDNDPTNTGDPKTPLPQATVDCYSEFLPTKDWVGVAHDRTLHFRLTARDGHLDGGGVGHADTTLKLVPTAGPFRITAPAGGAALARGGRETVRWNVAGTNAPPIGVALVKISLSTDGGATFGHVLAASTPNDGAETLTMPDTGSSRVRVKVEAVGSIFFDVSHGDAALEYLPEVGDDVPDAGLGVQYSDALPPATITASDRDGAGSALTATAAGLPAGLALTPGPASAAATRPGTRTFTVSGTTTAQPGAYPVTVTVTDAARGKRTTTFPITIAAESATAQYTGDAAVEGAKGTAALGALVAEVADGSPGDLRRATVTFREGARTLCGPVAADTAGRATCAATLGRGRHTVDAVVGGAYAAPVAQGALGAQNPELCNPPIALTAVTRKGARVGLTGFAERRFAGQRVTLTAGKRTAGHATVAPTGRFSARVKAPRGAGASRTAYRAVVAGLRSPAVRLGQPLAVTSVKRAITRTRLRGRLTGPRHARRALMVVRSVDCGPTRRAALVETDARGRFTVTLARPKPGTTAVYRVRTASGRPRATSLPVAVRRP